MKMVALYDIHGNLPALEAALAVIERARCDAIYHTGDQRLAHNQNEQLSPTLGTVSGHSAAALGHIGRDILAKHIGRRGAAVRKEMLVKVCSPRKRGPRAVAGGARPPTYLRQAVLVAPAGRCYPSVSVSPG